MGRQQIAVAIESLLKEKEGRLFSVNLKVLDT